MLPFFAQKSRCKTTANNPQNDRKFPQNERKSKKRYILILPLWLVVLCLCKGSSSHDVPVQNQIHLCRILAIGLVLARVPPVIGLPCCPVNGAVTRWRMGFSSWSLNVLKPQQASLTWKRWFEPSGSIHVLRTAMYCMFFDLVSQIPFFGGAVLRQLRFRKSAFDECKPRWRTGTGHQRNWRVTVVETQAQHIPHSTKSTYFVQPTGFESPL